MSVFFLIFQNREEAEAFQDLFLPPLFQRGKKKSWLIPDTRFVIMSATYYTNQISSLKSQISALQKEKTSLETEIKQINARISALSSQKSSLQTQLQRANDKLASLRKKRDDLLATKASLETQLRNASQQNSALRSEYQSTMQNLDNVTKENENLLTEISSLQLQLKQKLGDISSLQKTIETLQGELRQKDDRIQRMATEISALQQNVNQKDSELKILRDTLKNKESEIADIQNSKVTLQQQFSKATTDFNTLVDVSEDIKRIHETRVASYIEQIEAKQTKLQILLDETKEVRERIKKMEGENRLLESQIQTLSDERVHLKIVYDQLNADYQLSRQTIQNLRQSASDAADRFEGVKTQLTKQINDISSQYNSASQTVENLKQQFHNLNTRCPIIPNASFAMDKQTQKKFYMDNGVLRPLSDVVYASFGSPEMSVYETLDLCEKGADMTALIERDMYVIIDAASWMNMSEIKTLRVNPADNSLFFGSYVKDVTNAWVVIEDQNSGWLFRSLSANGPFLGDTQCSVPTLSDQKTPWDVQQIGTTLQYSIRNVCGKYLVSAPPNGVMLSTSTGDGIFLVPIGKVRAPSF